jgi:predicted RNA polymerase sigma factor
MAAGPAEGLALVDDLAAAGALSSYPHLPAARADLLARLGRHGEAAAAYTSAADLTRNQQERLLFSARADEQRALAPPAG